MDLTKHKFQEINDLDLAFSTVKTDKVLLAEAKERGFYDGYTKYNTLFSKLFYSGGRVIFKKDIDEEYRLKVWKYCRAFMQSWEPKHEEKEAICALLMSEVLEPELG